jgi:ATP-binding cassette, subfamily B, bacterial
MLMTETFPEPLHGILHSQHKQAGPPRFACRADVGTDGRMSDTFLAVTTSRLLVIAPVGHGGEILHNFALSDITKISIEPMAGVSALHTVVAGQDLRLLRFTHTVADDFSNAVERLQAVCGPNYRSDIWDRYPIIEEEAPPDWSSHAAHLRTFSRLWAFCGPHWRTLTTAVMITMVASIIDLLPPYLTKILVDDVLTVPNQFGLLVPVVLALVLSRIVHVIVQIWSGRMMSTLGDRLAFDARSELLRVLQLLPLKYYDTQQSGGLMARIARDAKSIHYFWIDFAPQLIQQGLMVIGMSAVLFAMNWQLAILVLAPIPIIVVASVKIEKYLAWYYGKSWDRWATFFEQITDSLSGIRVVKIFAQEQRQSERMHDENEKVFESERNIHVRSRTVRPILAFVVSIGGLLVWWFGGQQVQQGTMTLGTLILFFGYLAMFYGPVQYLTSMADWIPEMMTAITRTFEVIDSPAETYEPEGAVVDPHIEGRVEFRNVMFGYLAHQPVLQDLDVTIEPGEMIGLVGHSGAGKSTFIKLLCRFYTVDEGAVLIDGIDIRQMRLTDLRRQIGYVEQDPFLFAGSVSDNIAYGNPDVERDRLIEAAINANAHEFILKLPDGYDTLVGERGGRLSGGERQRIAIARAILHDPRILILDEPTSALDLETEKKIQEALGRLMEGRTTFAIAHRLSTLRDADRLLVLKQGRPVELGTHDELMAREGEYFQLVQLHHNVSSLVGIIG